MFAFFEKPEDYAAFMRVVQETWEIVPLPVYAMVAMPNHWHFVVRPETTDQVREFFRRLTVMHTMRWHAHYKTGGTGHLYQGRFKSFPIQSDRHLLTVMRYVERNPVRANLIDLAEEWQWGSAYARRGPADERRWPSQTVGKLHDGMHPTQQMATHAVTIVRHESAIVCHAGVHQS